MDNICFIGKYPPIQGGVSSSTYWHLNEIAKLGFEIHIISNSLEVDETYRQYLSGNDLDMLSDKYYKSGGKIYHHFTNPFFEPKFIPFYRPYITKLISKSIDVIKKYNCNKIYAYYLEPYGLVAYIVSTYTKIPYFIRHAGSDITRLYNSYELKTTYDIVLNNSSGILTTPRSYNNLSNIVHNKDKLKLIKSDFLPHEYFNDSGNKLDLNNFISNLDTHTIKYYINGWKNGYFDSNKLTIGIYGKLSKNKGISELIKSLNNLIDFYDFNLLFMGNGSELKNIQKQISQSKIYKNTFFIPFLPPWRVPDFIRLCDILCTLENNFTVKTHGPRLPLEILSCGRCLFISSELLNKQLFKNEAKNYENIIIINNVHDINEIENKFKYIFSNNKKYKTIGINAHNLISTYDIHSPKEFLNQFIAAINL